MKTLVAGWFSFEEMGATAGDLFARDVVCEWIQEAGRQFDIATAQPFVGGVDWREVDPSDYDELVFVCGPFGNGPPITDLLPRFDHCRLVGVNLSMLQPLDVWNPFHILLERDSSRRTNPDISLLAQSPRVPVIGLVRVDRQNEYRDRALHESADHLIDQLLAGQAAAVVHIDSRLDSNRTGLRSPPEVESVMSKMDVVVTTRLHGMVLALKNGVPALVVDPISGGAKISAQAKVLGWPVVFPAESLRLDDLEQAFAYCLTNEAAEKALACRSRATASLEPLRDEFIDRLRKSSS